MFKIEWWFKLRYSFYSYSFVRKALYHHCNKLCGTSTFLLHSVICRSLHNLHVCLVPDSTSSILCILIDSFPYIPKKMMNTCILLFLKWIHHQRSDDMGIQLYIYINTRSAKVFLCMCPYLHKVCNMHAVCLQFTYSSIYQQL